MPSSDAVRGNPKLEKTSKLVTTTLLVCKEATASLLGEEQARKDKQANTGLRPSLHCVCLLAQGTACCPGPGETQARKDKQAIHWPFVLPLMRKAKCSWTKGQ